MMEPKSAYRLAPISRWIYKPAWGKFASYDVPLNGAVSGEMEITVTTRTETCVGGARVKGGDVRPFTLTPGGPPVIPKSTFDGLLRGTLEIATFGRLGEFVEKRWPGMRDISGNPGKTVRELYSDRFVHRERVRPDLPDGSTRKRFTSKVCAGWLRRCGKLERYEIVECQLGRVGIRDLGQHFQASGDDQKSLAKGGNGTGDRYVLLGYNQAKPFDDQMTIRIDDVDAVDHPHARGTELYHERRHAILGTGQGILGTVVLTGKPEVANGNPFGRRRKKQEFVFSNPCRGELSAPAKIGNVRDVEPDVFDAFEYLNSGADGNDAHPGWTFWKLALKCGEAIPVFYLFEDDRVAAMGFASMFKVAFGENTHHLLARSHPDHLEMAGPDRVPDFPTTLLGEAAALGKDDAAGRTGGRAGRILFSAARGPEGLKLKCRKYVLSNPNEGYYPFYVRQDEDSDRNRQIMATFAARQSDTRLFVKEPELGGTKIWPAGDGTLRRETENEQFRGTEENGAKSTIHFVPPGTTFIGRVVFHNVLPQELGALVWALTATPKSNPAILRIGAAKSYGHGEVTVSLGEPVMSHGTPLTLDGARAAFGKHMEDAVAAAYPSKTWARTPQVQALLKSRRPNLDLSIMSVKEYADSRHSQKRMGPFVDMGGELGVRHQARASQFRPRFLDSVTTKADRPEVRTSFEIPPPKGTKVRVVKGRWYDKLNDFVGVVESEEPKPNGNIDIRFKEFPQAHAVKWRNLAPG